VGPTRDVNRNRLLRREGMAPRRVTPHQSVFPASLILTFFSTRRGSNSKAMATILPGRMNSLEPGVGFRHDGSLGGPSLTIFTEYVHGLRQGAVSGARLL
jgi:hypothetical protein